MVPQNLPFIVEELDAPDGAVVEVIAAACNALVAFAAYKTAVDLRTGRPIILRERARIIERSY